MRRRWAIAGAFYLSTAMPVPGHRLDEYLQATLIRVEKNRVVAQMYLTPGVSVLPVVLARMDSDGDGKISAAEEVAYAERVRKDVSLSIDGQSLHLQLTSIQFPELNAMKEGLGEIHLEFVADLQGHRAKRKLVFENRHEAKISAYLVNSLVPVDPEIAINTQTRNPGQSLYEVEYTQSGTKSVPIPEWASGAPFWIGSAGILLLTRLAVLWKRRYRAA